MSRNRDSTPRQSTPPADPFDYPAAVKYRRLGRSGLQVSAVGLGSWLTLGSSVEQKATDALIHRAHDLGINFFDTADVYSEGAGERALGAATRGLPRSQLVIASKAYFPMSDDPNDRGLSRKHLFESVDGSLQRLDTDYLDLHQCHRFDPEVPLEETVRAYADLIRQGKILYWGTSEWSEDQIAEACNVCAAIGAPRPVSNQTRYSLLERGAEAELFPAVATSGVGALVWGALAQGALTGKYRDGARPEGSRGADDFRAQFMEPYLKPKQIARYETLRELADASGHSMAQIAIAWSLRRPEVSGAVVGATRPSQLDDNAAASEIELDADLCTKLDTLFPA